MADPSEQKPSGGVGSVQEPRGFLERLAEVSPMLIFLFDLIEGKTLYSNRTLEEVLGYESREHVRAANWFKTFLHPDDVTIYEKGLLDLATSAEHQVVHNVLRFRRSDGDYAYISNWFTLVSRTPDGRPEQMVGCSVDVTQEKRAELALEMLERQLYQSQKLEAIGTVAGGIAHDFNNLLGVTLGYVDVLKRRARGDAVLSEGLLAIEEAARRAAALTRQLLAFARREMTQPVSLDLNQVVQGLEPMLRRLIPESIEIQTRLEPGLGAVLLDAGQIEQALMNLVLNARDAMPDGGTLTIETAVSRAGFELEGASTHGMRPSAEDGRNRVLLRVSDTGLGMDAATRAQIFEPFFTTKERGRGTGLGLSTVYGVVTQNEGAVSVRSEPGAGSTFTLSFPEIDEAPKKRVREELEAPAQGGSEVVLLVEDETMLRSLIARLLRESGYTVVEAPDADVAMRESDAFAGPIHLLLTDVVLPRMSGPDLVCRLARTRPAMRVLYMTGYTDDEIFKHGVNEGPVQLLAKPFAPKDLTARVRQAIDRGQRAESAAAVLASTQRQKPRAS